MREFDENQEIPLDLLDGETEQNDDCSQTVTESNKSVDEDSDASKSQKSQRVITFKSKRAPTNAKESSK